jgi:membrane associated rhomboid family serine protease
MTPTSVGMRCPECARERTKVRTARTIGGEPTATYALIAINVMAYIGTAVGGGGLSAANGGTGSVIDHGGLSGPAIAVNHEYWRIVTSGFLHLNLLHIGFNMFFLYFLGRMLEPAIGSARFIAVYFVSLLGGALGALIVTPHALTVGASGACFGILGAAIVVARDRGIPIMDSGLGGLLIINLIFSFTFSGISVGGHIGGLIGGVLAGAILVELGERRRRDAAAYALCLVVAVAVVAGTLAAARHSAGLPLT